MIDRSGSGKGWRDSVWNRERAEVISLQRSGLALPGRGGARDGSRSAEFKRGMSNVARKASLELPAPAGRVQTPHRYETGNRWLMRLLEWVTAKTWPLAVLDDMCTWFEEGSAGSRMLLGCAAAAVTAALLTWSWAPLTALQTVMAVPPFGGHGFLILVGASFLLGVTILPTVLGHLLGVLLRCYVLLNLCGIAALVGYGGWLLAHAKF